MRSKLDNTTSELAKVSSVLGKASLAIQASLQVSIILLWSDIYPYKVSLICTFMSVCVLIGCMRLYCKHVHTHTQTHSNTHTHTHTHTQPDSEHPVQRENLLATLLQLLNFHPSESSQQKTQLPLNSHHSLRMPSYHPGDLGIVPVAKSKTVSLTDNEGTSPQLPPINPRTSLTAFQQTVVQ